MHIVGFISEFVFCIQTAVTGLFFPRVAYHVVSLEPELSACCDVLFVRMFSTGVYSLSHSATSFVTNDVTE